jgi:hypothetical protein
MRIGLIGDRSSKMIDITYLKKTLERKGVKNLVKKKKVK